MNCSLLRIALRRMALLLAAALLAACTATTPPAPEAPPPAAPDPKVLGPWLVEQARGAPLKVRGPARIIFGAGGQFTGNATCNRVAASYTLVGEVLTMGPLAVTRMGCPDSLMEQEDRVLTALERAAVARVPSHGFLELVDRDGQVLMRASRLEAAE